MWDIHRADDLVFFLGEFNGHVARHIDGFEGLMEAMMWVGRFWKEECFCCCDC